MRNTVIALLVLGMGGQIFAQETVLFTAKLKKNEVPEIVLNAVDRDFGDLTTVEYLSVPEHLVAPSSLQVDKSKYSDYDSYVIVFAGKTARITATYNKDGKLVNSVDRYETKNAPHEVYYSIDKLFPEWDIKDGYKKMTTYDADGKVKNQFYKLSLENGDKIRKVYLNKDGYLVNSMGRLKM